MCFGVTPGNGWILNKGAFIAGSHNLKVCPLCLRSLVLFCVFIVLRLLFCRSTRGLRVSVRACSAAKVRCSRTWNAARAARLECFSLAVSVRLWSVPCHLSFLLFAAGFPLSCCVQRHDVAPGAILLVEHGLFFAAHEVGGFGCIWLMVIDFRRALAFVCGPSAVSRPFAAPARALSCASRVGHWIGPCQFALLCRY